MTVQIWWFFVCVRVCVRVCVWGGGGVPGCSVCTHEPEALTH